MPKASDNGFTPIQRKMLDVLSDGERHPIREMHDCLYETESPLGRVHAHVTALRRKLEQRVPPETIVCERPNRATYFRHIILRKPA